MVLAIYTLILTVNYYISTAFVNVAFELQGLFGLSNTSQIQYASMAFQAMAIPGICMGIYLRKHYQL